MTAASMCRACRSNPVACEGMCIACLRDKLAADRDRRHEQERERVAASRRGRPSWRPEPQRGHGHGRGRTCGDDE